MGDEKNRMISIGSYVEGYDVKTNIFYRGYLTGYVLMDNTDPNSICAKVAINHSLSVIINRDTMKLVSRYETLLKALEEYGLKYEDGKVVGRQKPKFNIGDIARHKNYGEDERGNIVIVYIWDNGYNYRYQYNSDGGSFGFIFENEYNLVKENIL